MKLVKLIETLFSPHVKRKMKSLLELLLAWDITVAFYLKNMLYNNIG
jgi:hypothetical protein